MKKCTKCGYTSKIKFYEFCPKCGRKMKEIEDPIKWVFEDILFYDNDKISVDTKYRYENYSDEIDCEKLKIPVKELLNKFKNDKKFELNITEFEIVNFVMRIVIKVGVRGSVNYDYIYLVNISPELINDVLECDINNRKAEIFYMELKTRSMYFNAISDDIKLLFENK